MVALPGPTGAGGVSKRSAHGAQCGKRGLTAAPTFYVIHSGEVKPIPYGVAPHCKLRFGNVAIYTKMVSSVNEAQIKQSLRKLQLPSNKVVLGAPFQGTKLE